MHCRHCIVFKVGGKTMLGELGKGIGRDAGMQTSGPILHWFYRDFVAWWRHGDLKAWRLHIVPEIWTCRTTIRIKDIQEETHTMKPPGPSYFINLWNLYRLGGLMASLLVRVDKFSQVLMSFAFDSWCMYVFCGALTLLFCVFLVTFYFLLVCYFALCSSLIFIWHYAFGWFDIALISH